MFGLVGESGSGKTTVGRLALRLIEPTEGKVIFDKIDLSTLSVEELRLLRSRMQVIFQDPMASLNPRMTVLDAISHPLKIHHPENSTMQNTKYTPEELKRSIDEMIAILKTYA